MKERQSQCQRRDRNLYIYKYIFVDIILPTFRDQYHHQNDKIDDDDEEDNNNNAQVYRAKMQNKTI